MGVYSNWKLTFDPASAAIVVLAYDAKMAGEMKIKVYTLTCAGLSLTGP